MKDGKIASMSAKDTTRGKDAEEEDDNHIRQKAKERAELVDKDERLSMRKIQMTVLAIKCYCRYNNYGERDMKANDGASSDECPLHRDQEMWQHSVQFTKTTSMRAEFVLELHKDLKKVQVAGISDEVLRSMIEDIWKYLIEDTGDLETNYQAI